MMCCCWRHCGLRDSPIWKSSPRLTSIIRLGLLMGKKRNIETEMERERAECLLRYGVE